MLNLQKVIRRGSFGRAMARFLRKRSTYQQSTWHTSHLWPAISPEHKVILLGVAGVGKTSYFLRVRDGVFVSPGSTCLPADFLEKKVKVSARDDFSIKIKLFDTAGGEKFRTLTSNYFQKAHAAVLMYSLDDELSFYKMEAEVENARPFLDHDFLWVVVGNKSDLVQEPLIAEDRVEAFCATLGTTLWLYVSVKTGHNVEQVLDTVARELYRVRYDSLTKNVRGQEHEDAVHLTPESTLGRKRDCKCRT